MNSREYARRIGLEEQEFLSILRLFLEVGSSDLQRLQIALAEKSFQGIIQAAHSLKGGAASFGFEDIFQTAREMENNARRNSLQGVAPGIALIRERLDSLARTLQPSAST